VIATQPATKSTTLATLRESRTLTHQVVERLRAAILSGQLAGGHVLRQEELAAQLGVSRIPVREALRQLDAEGFVHLHPHRGATVAALSPEEAIEIYDIRAALETQALRLAVPYITPAILHEAAALLDEIDAATDIAHWAELNWRFHMLLYAPANRPRLLELIKQLHDNVSRYLRSAVAMEKSLDAHSRPSQKQHRALLAACKKKDVELAASILQDHLTATGPKLAKQLKTWKP